MKNRYWIIAGILVFLLSACASSGPEVETPEETTVVSPDNTPEEASLESTVATEGGEEETEEVAEVEEADPEEAEATEGDDDPDAVSESLEEVEIEPVIEPAKPEEYESLGINELGHIMVVMYHGIKDNPPYHRTKEDFIKDMTYFYQHGYRPISMSDYLSGEIAIEAGMTPVVFTFDDGLDTTFSMVAKDGGLEVVEDTAVDLMEDFAAEYPDFGKEASLYIHSGIKNFKGDGTDQDNFNWLVENGYEIGNHSHTHANFKKIGRESLTKEIGQVYVYMDTILPGYEMKAMTYPFGARPKDDLMDVVTDGSYEGYDFDLQVAFREGPSGIFYPPMHKKFQAFNAPRVRGSEGQVQDLWWFLEEYEAHPERKYVSDGDPSTIVIPSSMEEQVSEAAAEKFQVVVY